ncbi:putative inorganic phosphate cotransporter isoform X2 [Eurosta solidaginis]|uniref:putative inorganic phosphate cotransporter isoform X2 n=1 Tax=Eurosta solidaginis TaxID=178769 RepID=UPI0035314DDD
MYAQLNFGPRFGIRHVQILLLFLNITCVYWGRYSISVLVVAMMNAATTNPDFPQFDWSEKERNYIISTFYWGYIMTQFPAGYLIRRFGAKIVMFCATFGTAILTLLTPYLVTLGSWQAYCAIRLAHGLFEGALFPCINNHIAKWSPPQERFVLGALAYTGTSSGTVVAMLLSGLIASSSLGWPGVSYISGGVCILWCVIWLIFGATNAKSSRFIAKDECLYIESSLDRGDDFHRKQIPIPWLAMLTSATFLTLIFTRCCEVWGSTTLQSQIPSYMNGVLNLNIKDNALFSTLPYMVNWIMAYVYIFFGKIAVEKGWLTLTKMRKTANTMATWIPAVLLIAIGFLDSEDMKLIISFFVVSLGFEAGSATGAILTVIDLAPNHAGVAMGIINSVCCIVPIASPLIVGVVVTDVHNRSEWQIVFGISAVILFCGNLLFITFGSAEAAPWDAPDFLLKNNIDEAMKDSEQESANKDIYLSDIDQQATKMSNKK